MVVLEEEEEGVAPAVVCIPPEKEPEPSRLYCVEAACIDAGGLLTLPWWWWCPRRCEMTADELFE